MRRIIRTATRRKLLLPALVLLLGMSASVCASASLENGSVAPSFDLEWLAEEGTVSATELFAQSPFTVLVIWNRGCPRCTKIALGMPAFADSLEKLDVRVVGLLFGPDDKDALRDLLWESNVLVPHLWDPDGRTAAAYGLGFQHLGIFGVDRKGIVHVAFDDQVADLPSLIPAIRRARAEGPVSTDESETIPAAPPGPGEREPSRTSKRSSGLPALQIDGRLRFLSSSGVRPGDTGLYGEGIENGTLFLFRTDIRATFSVSPGIDLIPWLRVSDEDDDVLTEGAERLSSRHGSITLRARAARVSAMLGAYPVRLSPLLLQRWDAQDAPPLGGVSGCGCGAGGSGLKQRSLEVLSPFYTFEGLSGEYARHPIRLRAFGAVPQWERRIASLDGPQRYRRLLGGAAIDIGRGRLLDPATDLPTPMGMRVGYLAVGDDRRSLDASVSLPMSEREHAFLALGRVGPAFGLSADGEYVDWRQTQKGQVETSRDGAGVRAGARFDHRWSAASLWADLYRIRTDVDFDPEFGALTYGPNQDGWRGAAGIRLYTRAGEARERLALAVFHRRARETELLTGEERRALSTIESVSLSARGIPDLLTEVHLIRKTTESSLMGSPTAKTEGLSFDARWEGIPAIDPMLRIDAIREGVGPQRHTDWQGYLSIRVLR